MGFFVNLRFKTRHLTGLLFILRGIAVLLEAFAGFLIVYLIISFYGGIIPTGELKNEGEVCIFVQSNGVHTDVVLPTVTADINWAEFVPTTDFEQNKDFDYIAIGWGDKGFFLDTPTWAELKFSTAVNAVFLPSSTAMHVAYSKRPMENESRRKVYLSRGKYRKMIRFIRNSFKMKKGRVDLIPGKGYTLSDNFYEARNSYHLFRTCNRWTNEALKSAGVRTGIFALFPDGILDHLQH